MSGPLLDIRGLSISLDSPQPISLVDRVCLAIPRGRVVALVGESGCGKSITALSILGLLPRPAVKVSDGEILWHGHSQVDLLRLPEHEIRTIRGREITMVFQEPMTALNPVYSIGEQIAEVLTLHRQMSRRNAWQEAALLLDQVGIAESRRRVHDYAHQFSGGMRQRVLIAMAIACRPKLLIADEPTTALDVTIQAQILELLRDLQAQTGMSILLITHDLGVVADLADEVYVMYAGRIVEHASAAELFASPLHPYTKGLFACTPRLEPSHEPFRAIPGTVPDPARLPAGCRFHPRCELSASRAGAATRQVLRLDSGTPVLRRCIEQFPGESSGVPPLREFRPHHYAACWELGS